jgi:WD40 repeat protein
VPEDNRLSDFHSMRFSPDGQQIVLDLGPMLYLWDAATGRLITSLRITSQVWASGGKLLGLLSGDMYVDVKGAVCLWDVDRRQFLRVPLPGNVRCLDIHPTGLLVATGDDEMAGLWDVATGKLVGPPLDHPAQLIALSFAPDGRRLLTCCGDDMARVWEVPAPVEGTAEEIRLWVEVLTGRELDEARAARPLGEAEREERRRQLAVLGGPPLP